MELKKIPYDPLIDIVTWIKRNPVKPEHQLAKKAVIENLLNPYTEMDKCYFFLTTFIKECWQHLPKASAKVMEFYYLRKLYIGQQERAGLWKKPIRLID